RSRELLPEPRLQRPTPRSARALLLACGNGHPRPELPAARTTDRRRLGERRRGYLWHHGGAARTEEAEQEARRRGDHPGRVGSWRRRRKIGRASCRERVEVWVVAAAWQEDE